MDAHRASPADAVAHLAVAVFLDARKVGPEQVASVKELVRAAAGADLAGGDDVAVQALPFAPPAPAAVQRKLPATLLRVGVAIGIVLSLCLGGWYLRTWRIATATAQRQTAAAMLGSRRPKARS